MVPTSSHVVSGAEPNAVSDDEGSPQTLLPASAEGLGLAVAGLLDSAGEGAGCAFPCPLGSRKMTTAAAVSATTSAAAMMKPGLVNGLLSVVLSVDWLMKISRCWCC
jgi:hypothetical protein